MKYKNLSCIEFIGIPGSGKSTIVNKLNVDLQANGDRFYCFQQDILFKNVYTSKIYFLFDLVIFFGRNVRLSAFFLKFILKNLHLLHFNFDRLKNLYIKLICIQRFASSRKEATILILDQGIFQLIWSFFYIQRTIPFRDFKKMCRALNDYLPEKYVYLQCSQHDFVSRIYEREKKCVFKKYDEYELRDIYTKGCALFQCAIKEGITVPVLDIETSGNSKSCFNKKIVDFIA